jgi:hypothetical protein
MADLRKMEAPDILLEIPQIKQLYELTDKYVSKLVDDYEDVHSDIMIETSTEYGIARREKILGISPDTRDTLESRRARVLLEWTNAISRNPLSFLWLKSKLNSLIGEENYVLSLDTRHEKMTLQTYIDTFGLSSTLDKWIDTIIPLNVIINSHNDVRITNTTELSFGGANVLTEIVNNSDNNIYNVSTLGESSINGATSVIEYISNK